MKNIILFGVLLGISTYPEILANTKNNDKGLSLTAKETQWLAKHPVIRFSPDPDYPPIESITSAGNYEGIAAEYLSIVGQKLGIELRLVQSKNWDEVLLKAKNREIDLLPAATQSPQRLKYLNFTKPHIVIPGVILVRANRADNLSLTDFQGRSISYVSGYIWKDLINKDHPSIQLDPVSNIKDGLYRVSFGDASAMIANLATASYYIKKTGLTNIRVAGESGYFARLAFATRNDWPELNSILEKALASITDEQKKNISERWISLHKQEAFSMKMLIILFSIILAMGLLAYIWNRTLRLAIQNKINELDESEQYNRMLFENTPIGLALSDMNGVLIDINQAFADITGYSIEALKQLSYWDLTPKKYEKDEARQLAALESTGEYGPYEKEYIHKNGSLIPVRLSGHIIERNNEKYIWSSVENILDKKKYEESLKESKYLLEKEVQIRTNEYKMAKEEADSANKAKSQFLAVMSHELRTPLTSIKGALGLLSGDALINEPDRARDMMRIANENSDRLKLLIDDILDFEKLQSGKMTFHKEAVEVGSLIDHAVEVNQGYADIYGIRFTIEENNCSSCFIFVDKHRLMQVFSNFLSNAIKHSPKEGNVRITTQCDNNKIRISVIDQGQGIPEHFRDSIFTKFSQADSSDIREKGGTGLGLVIAKEIIERHDGKIGYDSLLGQGATFYFELNINQVV